jgi:FixJ family two-component response regulator
VKKGAINYLEKPFSEKELLQSVYEAVALSHKILAENEEVLNARLLIQKLSPREIEILKYLMTGMLNKQIADKLNIVEHTVKVHRRSICEKLGVKSVPEIIHIAEKAGIVLFGNLAK